MRAPSEADKKQIEVFCGNVALNLSFSHMQFYVLT